MEWNNGPKILLIDDEPNILQFLELGLQNEGFQVRTAEDGDAGLLEAERFEPHLVVLDVMMPGMDGFEVCSRLKRTRDVAVIMLTAKEDVDDRVHGLRLGADDYMAKPFSFVELLARIQARLRNQFPHLLAETSIGPFRIDMRSKRIVYMDKEIGLSPTEFELLRCLVLNHGAVMSKSLLLEKVWGYDFGGEDNIVEVYIRSLREKLSDREHRLIRTIRGAGYRVDIR